MLKTQMGLLLGVGGVREGGWFLSPQTTHPVLFIITMMPNNDVKTSGFQPTGKNVQFIRQQSDIFVETESPTTRHGSI